MSDQNLFEQNNAPTETVSGESEETHTEGLSESSQDETTDSSEETEPAVIPPVIPPEDAPVQPTVELPDEEKPVAHYLGYKNGKALYQWEDMRFHAEDCPEDCVMEAIPRKGSKKK